MAFPRLIRVDIDRFLSRHGESAVNLIAAYSGANEPACLRRALELFPNDPQVLWPAINAPFLEGERAALIERFKTSDPNNPLPFLYSALDLAQQKNPDATLAELRTGLQKPGLYMWFSEQVAARELLFQEAGYSVLDAQSHAFLGQPLPQLGTAQKIGKWIEEQQEAASASGDAAGAVELSGLAYSLGQMFATPEAARTLMGQLVGLSLETRALKSLPGDAAPTWLGQDAASRLAQIQQRRAEIKALMPSAETLWEQANPERLAEYYRRNKAEGEEPALRWLKENP